MKYKIKEALIVKMIKTLKSKVKYLNKIQIKRLDSKMINQWVERVALHINKIKIAKI